MIGLDFNFLVRYLMQDDPAQTRQANVFQSAGGYINIVASGDNLWQHSCKAAGATDLLTNPDFATVP